MVLLLVDVINDLEFEGSEAIVRQAEVFGKKVADLKKKAKRVGIPAVYVNDNFGRWQSDFNQVLEHCLRDGVKGEPLARILRPDSDDYFVLKPKHSAFYATTLDTLLRYLEAHTVIIAGIAGNICILFTANDAYMRDYRLVVPSDCVISNSEEENTGALTQMERVLKADITASTALDLTSLLTAGGDESAR